MIYLDNNATTAPAPEVIAALSECLSQNWGNPSSIHEAGQRARVAREKARQTLSKLVNAAPENILFTSGATEATNQLLLGKLFVEGRKPSHIITSAIEHPCVLEPLRVLERNGWRITRLSVKPDGTVDPRAVETAIRPGETALVSIMLVNHDTGVIQPIREIAEIARRHQIPVHTDAVQAVGRIPVDFRALGIDFMTLSAHKFYGPKGTGALIARDLTLLSPLLFGGSQERSLRAGTENLPGICGLGAAARLAVCELSENGVRIGRLRDRLETELLGIFPDAQVNGSNATRAPNTSNISFPGIDALSAVMNLDIAGIAAATTSACSTGSRQPPHVLTAMGLSPELALSSLRFSLGRSTTESEIEEVVQILKALIPQLRTA